MPMLGCLATLVVQSLAADSGPVRPISQLVHTQWNAKDGAPVETRALAQTNDGYLWLGGAALVRFDGVRFVRFVPPDSTLRNRGIRRLVASRNGGLWIVWYTGAVSRLRDGQWTTWSKADELPTAIDLAESSAGIVVAATLKGLWRLDDENWRDANREWRYPGSQSQAVWFDRDDGLWSETESRVVQMSPGSDHFSDPGLPLASSAVAAQFAQERDGTIWMAELYRSVHTLRRTGDRLPEAEVKVGGWTILVDRRGSLWIGTVGDGLRRIVDPTRVRGEVIAHFSHQAESFTVKDGLLADVVHAVLEDRDGGIWVATSRGIERFAEAAFTPIVTPGASRDRLVYSTRDSAIWIRALNQGGFLRLDPSNGKMEEIQGFIPATLRQDRSGAIWTVDGRTIYNYSPEKHDFIPRALRRNDSKILRDAVVDSEGTAWFLDDAEGLMRLAGDSLVKVAPLPSSLAPSGSLLYDSRGRIWISRTDGVAVYERGQLTVFDPARGEAPVQVSGLFEDGAGNIWVLGASGLSRLEGRRFRTLSERQGVPERWVTAAAEDSEGAWWVATRTGVLRLPPGEIARAMADTTHVLTYRRFDGRDGVPGRVTSITAGADGRIWVGTDSVVSSVDPRSLRRPAPPPTLIEGVRIDDREVPLSSAIAVPPNGRDLEIDYTSTALAIADRIQFRYRLDGEDPAWRDVGSRRRAYYTHLAPGQYTFRVTASNGDTVWNESPAVLRIRVLPAWYQSWVFRTVCAVTIAVLAFVSVVGWQRGRTQRATERIQARYEAVLAERTRIANELHDTLLQGFTGITLQLESLRGPLQERADQSANKLAEILGRADTTLREAREMVWDIRAPELRDADLPSALERVTQRAAIVDHVRLRHVVSGVRRPLPLALETTILRIGREAVFNALQHASPTCVTVHLSYERRHVRLEVSDDGRGADPAKVETAPANGHWGIAGIRERAQRAGGTFAIVTAPQQGLTLNVSLPADPID